MQQIGCIGVLKGTFQPEKKSDVSIQLKTKSSGKTPSLLPSTYERNEWHYFTSTTTIDQRGDQPEPVITTKAR